MQSEIYRCPDGREAVLMFNEDTLQVDATTRDGDHIGHFKIDLVSPTGEAIDLMEDGGEAASFRLSKAELLSEWLGQGIAERVVRLVADETSLSPLAQR